MKVSEKTVERLIIYRRVLLGMIRAGKSSVFSHELAKKTGASSAQVRRDIMTVGYSGSPAKGYEVEKLYQSISDYIDATETQHIGLVGIGNLGRAILDYFNGRREKMEITAVFDTSESKVGRIIHAVRCYHVNDLPEVCKQENIYTVILTVPAEAAQSVANTLIEAGVKGILNYAPTQLEVPPGIWVENRDMVTVVEKAAYFARKIQNKETL